jgi:hypothetical protein
MFDSRDKALALFGISRRHAGYGAEVYVNRRC